MNGLTLRAGVYTYLRSQDSHHVAQVPPTRAAHTVRGRGTMAAVIALIALLLLAYALRHKQFEQTTGARNLEATYHVMLTLRATRQVPASEHLFLPTVTLGASNDKGVAWGATVATPKGDYIYTSFAPPGFLAPYLTLRILGAEPSSTNLARFNAALGAITSLILFYLLKRVLDYLGAGRARAAGGALAGTIISIFSMEALKSHGLVYWSHSLFQLFMAAALYALARYLMAYPGERQRTRFANLLTAAVFLGAWTEWTGYLFAIGIVLVLVLPPGTDSTARRTALKVLYSAAAAGLLTIAHLSAAIGLQAALQAYQARFFARNVGSGSVLELLAGYEQSFGVFIVLLGLIGWAAFEQRQRFGTLGQRQKNVLLLLATASFPLLENVLMLQHAGEFSFDRLKLIFPMSLCIALTSARLRGGWRIALGLFLAMACAEGYWRYQRELAGNADWAAIHAANVRLIGEVTKATDLRCAVLLSNLPVRGYTGVLLGRSVHEHTSLAKALPLLVRTNACSAVYLEGDMPFQDLVSLRKAIIITADGNTRVLLRHATAGPAG